MFLKIAICDDNNDDLFIEEQQIGGVLKDKGVVYSIDLFLSSTELLNSENKYDLVFLDVEMDKMNGIRTAEKLHDKNSDLLIFFVTNHEDYMDRALNKQAFRFWTKPINKTRLIYGIDSAINEIYNRSKIINVSVDRTQVSVLMKDIIYIYTQGRTTYIVTTKKEIATKSSMKCIKEQLNKNYFCESHASYCVNFNFVADYSKTEVLCEHGDKSYSVYMSKRKYSSFVKKFTQWAGGII